MVYKMDYLDLGSNCYYRRLGGGGGFAASISVKKGGQKVGGLQPLHSHPF